MIGFMDFDTCNLKKKFDSCEKKFFFLFKKCGGVTVISIAFSEIFINSFLQLAVK